MKFQDVTFAELVFYYEILKFSVHLERMAYLRRAFTACRQFIHYWYDLEVAENLKLGLYVVSFFKLSNAVLVRS